MSNITPEAIWSLNEIELRILLEADILRTRQNIIGFYAPSFAYYKTKYYSPSTNAFPTISITGNDCKINCKHCGGKVLETMHSAITPDKLFELGLKLKKNGAKGCLISGGCLPDGSVPLDDFIPVIGRFARELGFKVFVHSGIIKQETAVALKEACIDSILIDVIGSAETLEKIYNLKVTIQDYANSLKVIQEAKLNVVPHVIVGLNDGILDGEMKALQMIQKIKVSALVIIAFMPIHGTAMAKTLPPKPTDISKVVMLARRMFPKTPLILGCMRPKGRSRGETDILALKAGVDAIAFPSEEVVEYAKYKGYNTFFSPYCCAQMYVDAINL